MNTIQNLKGIILGLLIVVGISYAQAAWQGPTATPPDGNTDTPINVSATGQTKAGGLVLNTGGAGNGLTVLLGGIRFGSLTNCDSLSTDASGNLVCGTTPPPPAPTGSQGFYSSGSYSFSVPTGVTSVTIKAWGAGGGTSGIVPGGGGGYATAPIPVTPGENLTIIVGAAAANTGTGGYPGGGSTGDGSPGGGGYSTVIRGATELIIAGGGGMGASHNGNAGVGGAGGGLIGVAGGAGAIGPGGGGGTQSAGGTSPCAVGVGGARQGGTRCPYTSDGTRGGAGGGGYYGGGAGHPGTVQGSDYNGGGGGGGSSFIPVGGITNSGSGRNPGNTGEAGGSGYGASAGLAGGRGTDGKVVISW